MFSRYGKRFGGVLLVTVVGGCAGAGPYQQRLDLARQHEYRGTNVEALVAAAHAVFTASRPDYEIVQMRDGVRADHTWRRFEIVTLASYEETWDVRFFERDGLVVADAIRTMTIGDFFPFLASPAPNPIPNYNLFWARMDYMLQLRSDWVTCTEYRAEILGRTEPVTMKSFCSDDVIDTAPPAPLRRRGAS